MFALELVGTHWQRQGAIMNFASKLSSLFSRLVKPTEAATVVEYAVLLGLIALVCMSVIRAIGLWDASVFAQLTDGMLV